MGRKAVFKNGARWESIFYELDNGELIIFNKEAPDIFASMKYFVVPEQELGDYTVINVEDERQIAKINKTGYNNEKKD